MSKQEFLDYFRVDPKNAKANLKKSSVGAVEGYMTGKDDKKKKEVVGATKERDEMLKKKLENAIATGLSLRSRVVRKANWRAWRPTWRKMALPLTSVLCRQDFAILNMH